MNIAPEDVAALPWVAALRPLRAPYLAKLSRHSDLVVWHVDVSFETWPVTPEMAVRWQDKELFDNETWRKRPLLTGEASGSPYSCGEVELAARLRQAGFSAWWVSEYLGYPHVPGWADYCLKRNELKDAAPNLWEFDQELRSNVGPLSGRLGSRGGHPDVAALRPGLQDFAYIEYKGPGDKINEKQDLWAREIHRQFPGEIRYVAVHGMCA